MAGQPPAAQPVFSKDFPKRIYPPLPRPDNRADFLPFEYNGEEKTVPMPLRQSPTDNAPHPFYLRARPYLYVTGVFHAGTLLFLIMRRMAYNGSPLRRDDSEQSDDEA